MRVIAGKARGTRLQAPPGTAARPTSDRVKESLFNILGPRVAGARVLDLYAGSGALGIEALSRGAESAVFVDNRRTCLDTVRKNLVRTHMLQQAELILGDALAVLRRLAAEGRTFDIIFADPPYGAAALGPVAAAVAESGLLAPGGLLVMEHSRREEIASPGENLRRDRVRTYGDTAITILSAPGRPLSPGAGGAPDGGGGGGGEP